MKIILRRFLVVLPQLWLLSVAVFLLAQAMPGDALTGLIDPDVSPEDIDRLRVELGLNRGWAVQYMEWMRGIFRGDFGRSWHYARPVTEVIGERLPNTVRLSLVGAAFTYLLAIPLGFVAGRYRETLADRLIVAYTFVAIAMPTLVFALLNIFVFGFRLGWFPIMGSVDVRLAPGSAAFWLSRLHHLILPAFTAAILNTVGIINILRSEIIENESAEYVTTARAKGLPEGKVYSRHIFRNATLPLASGLGASIAGLLSGSVIIERVFGYPGMGNLFVTSITARDFPTANALIMIYGFIGVAGVLLSDIFITIADPRIRIR
ncbi:MAG: ABC transporter permease [Defluviitaleaceae bacterium]|nr:ABC transporter permease [Defluviitaleaceae bacterium]